jgi:hypothetical protein
MLSDIVSFLNTELSDFGAVLIAGIFFWVGFLLLQVLLRPSRRISGHHAGRDAAVRHFSRPPTRSGGD